MGSAALLSNASTDRALLSQKRLALEEMAAMRLASVIRYCGTDDASMSAAVRQGVDLLDRFFGEHAAPPGRELVVIYRNKIPGAITLELGYSADEMMLEGVGGEISASVIPGGTVISTMPKPGAAGVMAAYDQLTGARRKPPTLSFCWQRFPASDFRPWRGFPASRVFALLSGQASSTSKQNQRKALPAPSTQEKAK